MDEITKAVQRQLKQEYAQLASNLKDVESLSGHKRTRVFKVLETMQRFNELFVSDEVEVVEE